MLKYVLDGPGAVAVGWKFPEGLERSIVTGVKLASPLLLDARLLTVDPSNLSTVVEKEVLKHFRGPISQQKVSGSGVIFVVRVDMGGKVIVLLAIAPSGEMIEFRFTPGNPSEPDIRTVADAVEEALRRDAKAPLSSQSANILRLTRFVKNSGRASS